MTDPGTPATNRICFASTLHDPEDRFLKQLQLVEPMLLLYGSISITCTDTTSDRLISALHRAGVQTIPIHAGATGGSRRAALAAAIASSPDWVFYCDFDRWIHWALRFPDELRRLPSIVDRLASGKPYACVGRTERAFRTHPEVQQIAESATNHALGLVLGYPVDAIAGAAWMSATAGQLILRDSAETTAATDLEWPALIHRMYPGRVGSVQVEGLEFETATFHEAEIAQAGTLDRWTDATYDRPEVWAARLRLAADSVAALVRVSSEPGAR